MLNLWPCTSAQVRSQLCFVAFDTWNIRRPRTFRDRDRDILQNDDLRLTQKRVLYDFEFCYLQSGKLNL